MSLVAAVSAAKTEEDVKDAYIKALGLKAYSKNIIDIQSEEIWFEAKGSRLLTDRSSIKTSQLAGWFSQ